MDRLTVRRLLVAASAKSPTPRTGSSEAKSPVNPRTGSAPGGSVPERRCRSHQAAIEAALRAGQSVQRIHQDLVAAHGFVGSYDLVWSFVRKLAPVLELPFRRMESQPGAELQVDFCQGTRPCL